MGYSHTQRAPLHWLIWGTVALLLVGAWFSREMAVAWISLVAAALLVALLALCFRSLTVRDGGDALELRFGPLPLFRRRVRYDTIARARAARSALIDGWGVHWVPGRGWTWNLWGRDCVELETARGTLRVGSDDREGLLAFLESRLGERAA